MAKKYQNIFSKGSLIKDRALIQQEQIKTQIEVIPELEALIPPLREEEFKQLEENIKKEGCREALLIWKNEERFILVDGHNRYRICQRNQLDFKINLMSFEDIESVKDWMIDNQLGRRNLTSEQASYLRGLRYELEKKERGGYERIQSKGQNDPLTAERLGKEYNVSAKTIKRDAKYAQGIEKIGSVNPSLKQAILTGDVKVSKGMIQELSKLDNSKIQSIQSPMDIEAAIQVNRTPVFTVTKDDEKVKQLEYTKEKIRQLVSQLGRGNIRILEQLKEEVARLERLV